MHRKATIKTTRTTFPSCDEVCLQQQQQKIKTLLQYVAIRCVRIRHPQGHVASRTSLKTLNSNSVTVSAEEFDALLQKILFSSLAKVLTYAWSWHHVYVFLLEGLYWTVWTCCTVSKATFYAHLQKTLKVMKRTLKIDWIWNDTKQFCGKWKCLLEDATRNALLPGNVLGLERTANMWQSTCVHIFQPWSHVWLDSV